MNKIKLIIKLIFTAVNKPLIKVSTIKDKAEQADTNKDGLLSVWEIISELTKK